MKKYSLGLFLTLFGVLFLTSCVDEDLVKKGEKVKEGIPVTLKLPFASDKPVKIETRAGENTTYVDNLYILIFDGEGKRLAGEAGGGLVDLAPESTSITLSTTSGYRYIYGVANLSTSTLEITRSALDTISTTDQLKDLPIVLKENGINETTGKFLMSGFCSEANDNSLTNPALCAISDNGSADKADIVIDGTDAVPVLKLQRLQSKIKFNVKTGEKVKSFVLTSFSVMNIPTSTPLYEDKTVNTTSPEYWFNIEENKTLDAGSRGFTFYMLENKQQKKDEAFPDGNANVIYKSRSDSKYAPEKGTYIILKGAYEGPGDKYENGEVVAEGQPVQASVVYYIYLGYVDNVLEDYNSLRNKDYTYTVTVNGVNSIIVEAELETDDPSAGGDVYYESGGEIFNVDAHYASKVMKFKKSELAKDDAAKNIKILVSSWNTVGFEDKDKEWLTFIEGGRIDEKTEYPVRYPGKDKVLSADRFVDRLKEIAGSATIGDDEEFYFTCFINENYPIKDVDNESDWTSFVNRPSERMAQIICRAQKHNDSQTIDAAYLIRQKPIYTFFSGGDQPWGVESINETTEFSNGIEIGLRYGGPTLANNNYDGRANMLAEVGTGGYWYQDGYAPATQDKPDYAAYVSSFDRAYAACMQRNRDEDGNGIITEDEMKWYLPAIFQYTDMSIGANALPKTVQLYSDEDYDASNGNRWRFKHYVSNSNKQIYWGEEGGPYGGFSNDGGWNSAWEQATNPYTYHIRCVRNLGSNSLVADKAPSPVASMSDNMMDLSDMSSDALRPNKVTGELGVHSEREIASLPYSGSFIVAKNKVRFKFVGKKSGDYALSDRNGWYYVVAKNDNVKYAKGNPDSPATKKNSNYGPYKRDNDDKMVWVGDKKGDSMFSDKNGYFWDVQNSDHDPKGNWKQTAPHSYVYVGAGKGIYNLVNDEEGGDNIYGQFGWADVNIAIDKTSKSPCAAYSEQSDRNDVGTWRLPNMRELLLMVSHSDYKGTKLMSRTYYSFYLNDILNHGKTQQPNGKLDSYTIYSPMDQESREGFAYNDVVYLIKPGNDKFYIRCVKDN